MGRFLDEADSQPHRSRYWPDANPNAPEVFRRRAATVCDLYEQAGRLAERGIHLVSTDEKTGIQASERLSPDIPMGPGRVRSREYESTRHGALCLAADLAVWFGRIIAPTLGPTRTEADFVAHVERTVATDPAAGWVFIMGDLNAHQSGSPVLWVARTCEIEEELGEEGKCGMWKSRVSRAAFLSEEGHRIRFVSTPEPTSWLDQVEMWFGILVRKCLRRSSFGPVEDFEARIVASIAYFNRTMAKPIRWLYSVEPKLSNGTD